MPKITFAFDGEGHRVSEGSHILGDKGLISPMDFLNMFLCNVFHYVLLFQSWRISGPEPLVQLLEKCNWHYPTTKEM